MEVPRGGPGLRLGPGGHRPGLRCERLSTRLRAKAPGARPGAFRHRRGSRHPRGSGPGRPDGRVLRQVLVQVGEVRQQVVQEVAGLAAQFGVGEGQRRLLGRHPVGGDVDPAERRSKSIRSVDSVKSSSARCGRAARGPWGPGPAVPRCRTAPTRSPAPAPIPRLWTAPRSDSVSARYTSPAEQVVPQRVTSARR
ncbi:hypothetical protein LT493_14300 [Streptomyces tricolor]|nr:hypothetical protein [Streptomyces tricolor]